jgi:uncharacterized membrane protein YukC
MCEVSRMDFSFWSAVVDGLIFVLVLRLFYVMYFIRGMLENTEEIVVGWNNKIVEMTSVMTISEFKSMVQEAVDSEANAQAISDWDNAEN